MPYEGLNRVLTEMGLTRDSMPQVSFHKDYSGYEIILLAIEMEKVGYVYYKKAQKLASSREVADIFKLMAQDELEHIKILNREIEPFFKKGEYHWENEETVAQYLSRDTESSVFTDIDDLKNMADKMKSEDQALDLCIEGEKKAIAFYKKIWDQTSSEEGKKAIHRILEEEKKHVEKLRRLKEQLKK